MEFVKYIKGLVPHLKKEDIAEDNEVRISELRNSIIPSYERAKSSFKDIPFNSKDLKDVSRVFYANYSGKSRFSRNYILEIESKLENYLKNLTTNSDLIDDVLEKDVLKDGITIKKGMIIRTTDISAFVNRYLIDLLSYTLDEEIRVSNPNLEEEATVTKLELTYLEKNLIQFSKIFGVLSCSPSEFLKANTELPEVVFNESTAEAVEAVYGRRGIDKMDAGMIAGFVPNPFYHIGVLAAEWTKYRYDTFKDKKTMLEHKVLYLKQSQDKEPDPSIEKQIAYYQKRIDDYEYKMLKIEESVE